MSLLSHEVLPRGEINASPPPMETELLPKVLAGTQAPCIVTVSKGCHVERSNEDIRAASRGGEMPLMVSLLGTKRERKETNPRDRAGHRVGREAGGSVASGRWHSFQAEPDAVRRLGPPDQDGAGEAERNSTAVSHSRRGHKPNVKY